MKLRVAWALAAVVPALSGCHTLRALTAKSCYRPRTYMKAGSIPPLKIPGDLNAPNTGDALVVPPLKGPSPPPPKPPAPCLDAPPSYVVPHAQPAPRA